MDKYLQLKTIRKEWALADHDLTITCSDEKYQKMTISALKQSVYRMPDFPIELKTQFEAWAAQALPKVARELGKVITDQEILTLLGQGGAAPATMQPNDAPITDFSSIVGGMNPGGAAAQK